MKKKRTYSLLQIEVCCLQDDLIRTSDEFKDGNEGEWDVFN